MKYFTINKKTNKYYDIKNLKEFKRLDKKGIEFIIENPLYIGLFLHYVKRDIKPNQLVKILKVNPELLEIFI